MTRVRLVWTTVAVAALVALWATLAVGLRSADRNRPAPLAAPVTQVQDRPAPPLTGTTLAGHGFDLAALRGRVVVVNVWASWCGACRDELPLLVMAGRRWFGQGLSVAGIDIRDNPESARRTLAEVGARELPTIADPHGTLAVQWGATGVPETFVVDRAGRVRVRAQGAIDLAWLERQIPPLLAAPAP